MRDSGERGIAAMRGGERQPRPGRGSTPPWRSWLSQQIVRKHFDRRAAANDNAPDMEAHDRQEARDHDPALRTLRPPLVRPAKAASIKDQFGHNGPDRTHLAQPGEIDATLHGGLGTFLEWAATGVGNSTGKGGAIT